jgi:hypothetical protein
MLRPGKPEEWYCISRHNVRAGKKGLFVNVARHGCTARKYFSVSDYASEDKALEAAQAWRDAVLALVPPMTRMQLRSQPRKNNTSGTPGVYRARKSSGYYWVARVAQARKSKSIAFSIKTHGEKKAKELAIAARERFLLELDDSFHVTTQSSEAIAQRDYGSAQQLSESLGSAIVDEAVKEAFLQRLRDAGLIDKPPAPPVQRRHYRNRASAVWEATVWFPDGKRKVRRFAVSIHGEDEAKRLADAAHAALQAERDALLLKPAKNKAA